MYFNFMRSVTNAYYNWIFTSASFYCVDLVDKFTVGLKQKQQLKMQFVQHTTELQFLEINNTTLNLGVIFHIWWDNKVPIKI